MSEEFCISDATIPRLVDLIDEEGHPRMHWRINIAEGPFIGRKLAIWMNVVLRQYRHTSFMSDVSAFLSHRTFHQQHHGYQY